MVEHSAGKKKVVVIGTGGTIAMKRGPDGSLVPYKSMRDMIRESPEMKEISKKYAIETMDLMNADSSDRDPKEWKLIGKRVVEAVNRNDIEGVVITHGTDTMAYTSHYLDYSIKNLRKPVVLTGSQIAASEPNSDGIPNLKDAITVAAEGRFAEVLISFGGEIWKAENAIKARIWDPQPFRGVERKPVGSINGGKIETAYSKGYFDDAKYDEVWPRGIRFSDSMFDSGTAWLEDDFLDFGSIEEVMMRPGIKVEKLMELVKSEEGKAIIIHGFGAGNIAERYHPFIEEATKCGKLVVMCSQAEGPVDLLEYGLGRRALEKGALPAGDRTAEEVYMRLAHVMGITKKVELMTTDRSFQCMLKDNGISLAPSDFVSMGKYLFLSGSKFAKEDDSNKYAELLGTGIPEEDVLKHYHTVDQVFRHITDDVVNGQLRTKLKSHEIRGPYWSSVGSGPLQWNIDVDKTENGITSIEKRITYGYDPKTEKGTIVERLFYDKSFVETNYEFDLGSGKRNKVGETERGYGRK